MKMELRKAYTGIGMRIMPSVNSDLDLVIVASDLNTLRRVKQLLFPEPDQMEEFKPDFCHPCTVLDHEPYEKH